MEQDVRAVAQSFQPALGRLLREDPPERVHSLLREAFEGEGDYGIFVYDPEGALVARAGRFGSSSKALTHLVDSDFDPESSGAGVYSEAAGEAVYSYFAPLITRNGTVLGVLQVVRLRRDYERFLSNLRLAALGIFLFGTVLLVAVVTAGYQKAIGASLERLSESMRTIIKGDRLHRASPTGPREIHSLGEALNQMLDSIDQAEREILERKEREQKLGERLHHSEKLASLGNIAAGVAHELGTPMSVIVGNAQRALRQAENPPKTAEALQAIRMEVERMDCIVRQLLEFGRAGGSETRPIAPEQLARSALNAIESIRETSEGTIVVRHSFKGKSVCVNPVRVELALINLLKNALEAQPGGRVGFSWRATPNEVTFEVTDEGSGIDADLREKIFEPFFTTKGPTQGAGLGLAIVAQVADECDGKVQVVSENGKGTCFFLTIPFEENNR